MRTRSIMLLALALGCGLVASIGISQVMDARSKSPDQGERLPVFVALADIGPTQELNAQNIKLEEWPKNIIPQGALTRLEEVEGKKTRIKIYAGEPILSSKLLGANEMTGAAKDIPTGYRVAYVKVDSVSGSSNLILPGDRVDVLVFRQPNNDSNATAAKIILQDIKVFAVDTQTETAFAANKDEKAEAITAKTISLLVTPKQSEILHAASEIAGSVKLVLRNPDDDEHVVAGGATIGDIFGPDERSDRAAEKSTEKTARNEGDDVTAWLNEHNGKDKDKTTPIANSSPLPPAAPPLPAVPLVPRKKMIVIYGSEVVTVEIPENGDPPINQPQSGTPGSGGGGYSPLPPQGSFGIPSPPAGGGSGSSEESSDDTNDASESSESDSDSSEPTT